MGIDRGMAKVILCINLLCFGTIIWNDGLFVAQRQEWTKFKQELRQELRQEHEALKNHVHERQEKNRVILK